jgi:hypothetical protein
MTPCRNGDFKTGLAVRQQHVDMLLYLVVVATGDGAEPLGYGQRLIQLYDLLAQIQQKAFDVLSDDDALPLDIKTGLAVRQQHVDMLLYLVVVATGDGAEPLVAGAGL